MGDNKKYYWLKLKNDFFNQKEIKKLRKIAGGDTYTIIYLKMQLLSLKNNGLLFYDGIEDTFAEELALDIDEEPKNVEVTLLFLQKCGFIEQGVDDEYLLTQASECMGTETASTIRSRRHREKLKTLQCNTDATKGNTEIEKEIELDKEKELELNKEKNNVQVDRFAEFWQAYPKRKKKGDAEKAFKKIKPTQELHDKIMFAISKAKQSKDWLKDNGQYIPYPATWLNAKCWEDELETEVNTYDEQFEIGRQAKELIMNGF